MTIQSLIVFTSVFLITKNIQAWTDNPNEDKVKIRYVHVEELRTAINQKRQDCGLTPYNWGDSPLSNNTKVRSTHIEELQTALKEALAHQQGNTQKSQTLFSTPLTPKKTKIKGMHITELRQSLSALTCSSPSSPPPPPPSNTVHCGYDHGNSDMEFTPTQLCSSGTPTAITFSEGFRNTRGTWSWQCIVNASDISSCTAYGRHCPSSIEWTIGGRTCQADNAITGSNYYDVLSHDPVDPTTHPESCGEVEMTCRSNGTFNINLASSWCGKCKCIYQQTGPETWTNGSSTCSSNPYGYSQGSAAALPDGTVFGPGGVYIKFDPSNDANGVHGARTYQCQKQASTADHEWRLISSGCAPN